MKIKEQRQEIHSLPSDKLNEKLKELKIMLVQSYGFIKKAKVKREQRPAIRKEVARIKTELSRRNENSNNRE